MSSANLSSSLRTGKQAATAGTVALVAIAYFAVIIVALHFLRPDTNPIRLPTSSYAVAMIFPLDPEGAPQTLSGTIHRINGPLAFLSLTVGMILVSRRLSQDGKWRPVHRGAVTLSLGMLAMVVVTIVNTVTEAGFGGLAQRISLALIVTWYVLMASRLRSIPSGSVEH